MSRRTNTGFAWVSMMDLLFGMFGALVVLTVLISAKLGASSGVDLRPFHSLTVEVSAIDSGLRDALPRMHVSFLLFARAGSSPSSVEPDCVLAAANPNTQCLQNIETDLPGVRLVEFATSASMETSTSPATLLASVLINAPKDVSRLRKLVILPMLADVAVLLDLPVKTDQMKLRVRLSAKSGIGVWEPQPFVVSIRDLLARADRAPLLGAPLLPDTPNYCVASLDQSNCGNIQIQGGSLEFSW